MRIAETGRVRIANLRVLCTEAMEERGRLTCNITLDADEGPLDAVLRAHVVDEDGRTLLDAFRAVTLATGENQQSWTLTVEEAPRWWPRSLGAQPLCTLALSVSVADDTSDERMVRTAFRDVRVDDWKFSDQRRAPVPQGREPRADSHGARRCDDRRDPARPRARAGSEPRLRARARARRRVRSCTTRPTSSACSCGRTSRCSGATHAACGARPHGQARAMVDLLGHHPSVFLWCGHNAPFAADREPGEPWSRGALVKLAATTCASDMGQGGARPFRGTCARPARQHPAGRAPQRRAARDRRTRHRRAPLPRVVSRRSRWSRGASSPLAASRSFRLRVRRASRARDRGMDGARTLARSRLGPTRTAPRAAVRPLRAAHAGRRTRSRSTNGAR